MGVGEIFKYNLSIVVIINKAEFQEKFKQVVLTQKDISLELIIVDNISNQYKGARSAFNSVKDILKGKYIIFMHQDIQFLNEYTLNSVYDYLECLNDFGIVGIAGAEKINGKRIILSNIKHGKNKVNVGKHIRNITKVDTVDECFFVIRNEIFKSYPFSNRLGWHLYSAEQSLMYEKIGLKTFVIPINLWHLSDGNSLDHNYIKILKEIANDYPEISSLSTTVKLWKLNIFHKFFYLNYFMFKQLLKSKLKKG